MLMVIQVEPNVFSKFKYTSFIQQTGNIQKRRDALSWGEKAI